MEYSRSESTLLHEKYRAQFGELPEGLAKHAANQGQYDQMLDGMKLALETGKIPNWDDYVTPYPKRASPLTRSDLDQFGVWPEGSGETNGESGPNGTIIRQNEADAENRENAELERLRDAISEVFKANRQGKRVKFGKL